MPTPRPQTDLEAQLRSVQGTHARSCRTYGYDAPRSIELRKRLTALAAVNNLAKRVATTEFTRAERSLLIEIAAGANVRDESIGSVAA